MTNHTCFEPSSRGDLQLVSWSAACVMSAEILGFILVFLWWAELSWGVSQHCWFCNAAAPSGLILFYFILNKRNQREMHWVTQHSENGEVQTEDHFLHVWWVQLTGADILHVSEYLILFFEEVAISMLAIISCFFIFGRCTVTFPPSFLVFPGTESHSWKAEKHICFKNKTVVFVLKYLRPQTFQIYK